MGRRGIRLFASDLRLFVHSLLGGASRAGAEPLNSLSSPTPQGLRQEIQAHGPRLEEVLERTGALASLRSPEAEAVRRGQEQLRGAWAGLREAAGGSSRCSMPPSRWNSTTSTWPRVERGWASRSCS